MEFLMAHTYLFLKVLAFLAIITKKIPLSSHTYLPSMKQFPSQKFINGSRTEM